MEYRSTENILEGITDKKQQIKVARKSIKKNFENGIHIDEGDVWSSSKTRKEFTDSNYSKWLRRKNKIVYTDKLGIAANTDEIVKSVEKYSFELPNHTRKDNIIGFYRGDTRIRIGQTDYTADVILALDDQNKMFFYDIIEINDTKIEESTEPGLQKNEGYKRLVNSSNNSISNNSENSNTKKSVRMDSEGRVLKGYNDELKGYIEENKNNVIIKTEEELSAYIDEAFTNKSLKRTLFLGSIPQDIMTDIKNNIQNISDRDREKL